MVTLEDVKKNTEVQALVKGAQKQIEAIRIYRTFNSTYRNCISKSRRHIAKIKL